MFQEIKYCRSHTCLRVISRKLVKGSKINRISLKLDTSEEFCWLIPKLISSTHLSTSLTTALK